MVYYLKAELIVLSYAVYGVNKICIISPIIYVPYRHIMGVNCKNERRKEIRRNDTYFLWIYIIHILGSK